MSGRVLCLFALLLVACALERTGAVERTCSAEADCEDGTLCTLDVCNPEGLCEHPPVDATSELLQPPFDCKQLYCQDGREYATPDDGDVPQLPCVDSLCNEGELVQTDKPDGSPCSEGKGAGACQDGLCIIECDPAIQPVDPACDDGEPCTLDACDAVSRICVRQHLDNVESPEGDPPKNCRVNLCVDGHLAEGVVDDSDLPVDNEPCTTDICQGGTPSNPPLAQGTGCGPMGAEPPVCDAEGHCVGCNVPGDCGGQDTFCQKRTCDNRTCGLDNTPAGTPLPPAQQTAGPCKEIRCDGLGGTLVVDRPAGTGCDDGLFCTAVDQCDGAGTCLGTVDPCPGPDGDGDCSESCSESADACVANDPSGSACSDGLYCNGTDTCSAGSCNQHAGNPCPGPDGDANCVESCDEQNDSCLAADPDGAPCSDGVFCNGLDSCSGGLCSVHPGNPCAGADGDGNCSESCDETADDCLAPDPNGAPCSDGTFCNGSDSCNAGSCSVHAGDPCPGADGDGNCSESCDESADACTGADPNGSACGDGSFCNGTDSCGGGTCSVHTGDPCPGVDGDGNCSESCDETADACTAADPSGSACSDGLFCNGTDSCAAGACSVHTGDPCAANLGDADLDCSESCDDASDSCTAPDPNGSACSDGSFCTGTETCSGGLCGGSSGDPCLANLGDADLDCSESCDDVSDSCAAPDPNGSACSDGSFCTGTETCSGGMCGASTGDPCVANVGDADLDCSESCDDASDSCTAPDPNGSFCDDALYCTGTEACLSGSCQSSGDPCAALVGDADADCAESCHEPSNSCTALDPNGSACSDGVHCNGAESCSAGVCGQSSGNPCPGQDVGPACNDSCDESSASCTAFDADGTSCGQLQVCQAGACGSGCGFDLLPPAGPSCPPGCDSCVNDVCIIDCGANACQSMTIGCPSDWACEVQCSGSAACTGATVACPSLYACDVICSANGACQSLVVDCPLEGTCELSCPSGNGSTCAGAQLECGLNDCSASCAVGGPVTTNNCSPSCACAGCP